MQWHFCEKRLRPFWVLNLKLAGRQVALSSLKRIVPQSECERLWGIGIQLLKSIVGSDSAEVHLLFVVVRLRKRVYRVDWWEQSAEL
jgi:hypothetical protein